MEITVRAYVTKSETVYRTTGGYATLTFDINEDEFREWADKPLADATNEDIQEFMACGDEQDAIKAIESPIVNEHTGDVSFEVLRLVRL